MNEVHKRTSLADIGETLDKLVLDSKARSWKYYDLKEDHDKYPKRASNDYTN